ncbi:tail collar domain [Caudoviricetes sp.]|nr:tail collar domain [Caudoviricetes sp.]
MIVLVLLFLLLSISSADAGTITRPTKSFGGSSFVNGVVPQASDFNGDIDTIYSEFNGNISNANISSSAAIDGSKFSPSFTINSSVTSTAPCYLWIESDQAVDLRRIYLCLNGGNFSIASYADGGTLQNTWFTIARATGLATFGGTVTTPTLSADPDTAMKASTKQYVDTTVTTRLPSGSVTMYVGATAPTGWLLCDGSAVSRTTYADLFAVVSTTYGAGDGFTTFNVPDFRGRVAIGTGTGTGGGASGTGLPAGGSALTAVSRGTWKGEETHTLSIGEMPAHDHSIAGKFAFGTGTIAPATGSPGAIDINTASGATATSQGSGTGHNVIQPVMGVLFIIKT